MKIEMYVQGPHTAELAAEFLPQWYAAVEADAKDGERRRQEFYGRAMPAEVAPTASEGTAAALELADDTPRAYGEAGGGRKRRTKDEMAEDAEIEELAGKIGRDPASLTGSAAEVLASLREVAAGQKPNISATPEDRQPPAEPLTGEIVEDEAKPATRDDLKAAMTKLTEKHGMPHGLKLIGEVFAPYGKAKQSDFDDDPAVFAELIGKLEARL